MSLPVSPLSNLLSEQIKFVPPISIRLISHKQKTIFFIFLKILTEIIPPNCIFFGFGYKCGPARQPVGPL